MPPMNALGLLAATEVGGLVALLLYAVLAIVVLGLIYWVAQMFLPEPIPVAIVVVLAIVILLYLIGDA